MRADPLTADTVVAGLREFLRADQILTDAGDRDSYSHDDAEWAEYHRPVAVALAETTDEVAAVVRYARAEHLSVVPRGAGTGLSGGANALEHAIVLSLERMTRVLEVDAAERYVIAEAGVINDDLRTAVAAHGLWYPPDPASYRISTIGGNAATNAGGICCVKYGVTRDYVLGMTVVLADGEKLRQILLNLLSNAVRHSPVGASITLAATRYGGDCVAIEVSDTGAAIPEERQAFTFHGMRFFVMKRVKNRITRLRIRPIDEEPAGGAAQPQPSSEVST